MAVPYFTPRRRDFRQPFVILTAVPTRSGDGGASSLAQHCPPLMMRVSLTGMCRWADALFSILMWICANSLPGSFPILALLIFCTVSKLVDVMYILKNVQYRQH